VGGNSRDFKGLTGGGAPECGNILIMSSFPAVPGGPTAAAQAAVSAKDRAGAFERVPLEVASQRPRELGGRPGPDPTRYGDWEREGRCIDF